MCNTDLLPSTGPESFGLANIHSGQCEVLVNRNQPAVAVIKIQHNFYDQSDITVIAVQLYLAATY